jgi:putative YhbY family RNA-binding protein
MIELAPAKRRAFRAAAHHLNPVVSIGQKGLQPSVLAEIDRSLKSHELIKVRLYGQERDARDALCTEICSSLSCAEVQQIGNLLVLWRENPEPDKTRKPAKPKPNSDSKRSKS